MAIRSCSWARRGGTRYSRDGVGAESPGPLVRFRAKSSCAVRVQSGRRQCRYVLAWESVVLADVMRDE